METGFLGIAIAPLHRRELRTENREPPGGGASMGLLFYVRGGAMFDEIALIVKVIIFQLG
jgi:hypothetical protein